MYEKIEQGKHIKKGNKIEIDPKQSIANVTKKPDKKKKEKNLTVQQLNVEVKLNQENFRKYYFDAVRPFLQKYCLGVKK